MLNDRLNTINMLRRRHKFLEKGYNCVLCHDNREKTIEHLLFCPCSSSRWFALGIVWRDDDNIHEKLFIAKRDFPYPFFMEVVMIGAWCIWNERNALIFNGKDPSLLASKAALKRKWVIICVESSQLFMSLFLCG